MRSVRNENERTTVVGGLLVFARMVLSFVIEAMQGISDQLGI